MGINEKTIGGWKCKDKWEEKFNGVLPTNKRSTPHKETVQPEGLSDKQVLFVAEYLTDFNATRAAIAVGYSKKTANQIGWQLLHKTSVQTEIQRQMLGRVVKILDGFSQMRVFHPGQFTRGDEILHLIKLSNISLFKYSSLFAPISHD